MKESLFKKGFFLLFTGWFNHIVDSWTRFLLFISPDHSMLCPDWVALILANNIYVCNNGKRELSTNSLNNNWNKTKTNCLNCPNEKSTLNQCCSQKMDRFKPIKQFDWIAWFGYASVNLCPVYRYTSANLWHSTANPCVHCCGEKN